MNFTVNNWMVLTINSNKELVTRGVDISKKFFKSYDEARKEMIYASRCYVKAKNVEDDKYCVFIDCDEYFVQMQIIDCSKEIQILR